MMKGSAFIWLVAMVGFITVGFLWVGLGEAISLTNEAVDPLITNSESRGIFLLLQSLSQYWPFIILISIVVFVVINSQKSEGVFG